MTHDDLRQRRGAAYAERYEQLHLRGCLLADAEGSGLPLDSPLPPALAAAHAAYSRRITELCTEIRALDEQIAAEEVKNR